MFLTPCFLYVCPVFCLIQPHPPANRESIGRASFDEFVFRTCRVFSSEIVQCLHSPRWNKALEA